MKRYYVHRDGRLFKDISGDNYYFMTIDGAHVEFIYNSTKVCRYWSDYQEKAYIWKEVTEEEAFELLHRSKYDFTGLINAFNAIDANKNKQLSNKSPLLYRHIRHTHPETGETRGNGGVTVGVILNYDKKLMYVYPAICHEEETYSKHVGCDMVDRRVLNKEHFTIKYNSDHSIVENIFVRVAYDQEYGVFTNGVDLEYMRTLKSILRGMDNAVLKYARTLKSVLA